MAVASKNRHNAAFVVGSVLGAVAGAAVALWKTPYTGEELRSKISGAGSTESHGAQTYTASPSRGTTTVEDRSIKDKVLSGVEKTLAPIVGVELGKTANGSGAETPAAGDIKVNAEHGSTMLRHPHAWQGDTSAGDQKLGLSQDKVDAEKWAAAYGTGASAPETQTTKVSQPKVETTTTSTPPATGSAASTAPLSREAVETGEERLTGNRSRINADSWAKAYGTSPAASSPETRFESKEAESAAQTGLGAKPAYPDNDQTGRQPVDAEAPDSNVAEVSRDTGTVRQESDLGVEDAASVDDLTTPKGNVVPDSALQQEERTYHPFPKLGRKEN